MSFWHNVTHVGSFVKSEVKKGKTIYTASVHSVADAVSDAAQDVADDLTGSSGSFLDDVEHTAQFILTKANGTVKHFMDSDGDGLFNKKVDQLIVKAKAPAGSFFSNLDGEAHSILGNGGTMYIHGLQHLADDAYSEYKSHLGGIEDAFSGASLGFWDSVDHGISTLGSVFSGPSVGGSINGVGSFHASF